MNTFKATQYVGQVGEYMYKVLNSPNGWYVIRKLLADSWGCSPHVGALSYDGTWKPMLNTDAKDYRLFHSENKAFEFIKDSSK